jgi:predicted DNA-binding transcriptional regulator YafY
MGNVATRLLSLIFLLQSRACIKASELAEELGVSKRTVHRYIKMLEEMGIPVYSERGPHGGFSLVRGYKLPPLIFTAEEATVLYMGANLVERIWGQLYKDAITAVTAKLDNVLPDDLREEVAQTQQRLVISGLMAKDYRPWAATMHALRECIAEHRRVRITYRSFELQETCRDVAPYALTFRAGLWYLVAHCHLRDAMRTFRVDRIQDLQRLATRFTVPQDFSAQAYIERTMRFEAKYTVVIHLNASVAPHVREYHSHWMELTDHDDGSVTATFDVSELTWATGWVLSYGGAARVLEPPELIAQVKAQAHAVLTRYSEA